MQTWQGWVPKKMSFHVDHKGSVCTGCTDLTVLPSGSWGSLSERYQISHLSRSTEAKLLSWKCLLTDSKLKNTTYMVRRSRVKYSKLKLYFFPVSYQPPALFTTHTLSVILGSHCASGIADAQWLPPCAGCSWAGHAVQPSAQSMSVICSPHPDAGGSPVPLSLWDPCCD